MKIVALIITIIHLTTASYANYNDTSHYVIDDYVITTQGDTIYGEIQTYNNYRCKCIKMIVDNKEQDFPWSRVVAYRHDAKDCILLKRTKKNGKKTYTHTKVLLRGKASFLQTRGYDSDIYYVLIDSTGYICNNRKFSKKIWSKLSQCSEFASKYESYAKGYGKKKILFFPKQEFIWKLMLEYYNENC